MITATIGEDRALLLVGPVRGLAQEARETVEALREFAPTTVGLGLSEEEMRGLINYFVAAEAEPVVPLTATETSEVEGLVRFGEVRVPNPAFVDVLSWCVASQIPAEPLDPNDEHSAALFTEHIGYVALVRRTVGERRVARNPPRSSTADEFALAWDREISRGRGSRELAQARDRHFARGVGRLRATGPRLGLVVDRERFESIRSLLENGVPPAMDAEP